MKTVDLEKYPEESEPKMEGPKDPKPYCPTLYITGTKLRDMPTKGKATIEYNLKRSTKDFGDGEDSYELEVNSISYDPAESEASIQDAESQEEQDDIVNDIENDGEEEGQDEEKPSRPMPRIFGKAKIDSSKG